MTNKTKQAAATVAAASTTTKPHTQKQQRTQQTKKEQQFKKTTKNQQQQKTHRTTHCQVFCYDNCLNNVNIFLKPTTTTKTTHSKRRYIINPLISLLRAKFMNTRQTLFSFFLW